MSATQPIGLDSPLAGDENSVKRQLDALANGECDYVTFLNAMKERFRLEPDENWEVLSLLDQYYRRGKISQEVFRAVKNGVAEYILGPQGGTQAAAPALRKRAPTSAPAQAPSAKPIPVAPVAESAAAVTTPARVATPAPVAHPGPVAAPTPVAAPASIAPPAHTFTGRTPAAPEHEVVVGDVLRNRYRVETVLARGGSGSVFEVSDGYRLNLPPAGKRLALKLPRMPDPRGNFISQLRHEFHQLQNLSHPNIVRAFDFDRDAALSFFTMELLHGVHLPQILHAQGERTLPRAYALAIVRDVGSAIAYAHSRNVIHGDVNPQNIFITTNGELRLLGFGAAHKLSPAAPVPDFERASAVSESHRYASCEVLEGNHPDVQDDIYSLSCIAYLLLKGRHPYADSTSVEARGRRLRPPRPAGLTYQQWRMLRAGLRTEAKNRPGSVREWLDAMALDGAADRLPAADELIAAPAHRSRRGQTAVAAAVILALIGGVYYWFNMRTESGTLPPSLASAPAGEEPASPTNALPPNTLPLTTALPPTAPMSAAPPPSAPLPPSTASMQQQSPTAAAQPMAKPITAQSTPRPALTVGASLAGTAVAAPTGPARVEMIVDTLDALPTDTAVHVAVHRKGNLHGATSFTWWTESGTAKPGLDFSPVLPHVEHIQDGESSAVLTVPLMSTARAQEKSFYVGIEATDGGAQIGARALTQVTLPPTN